jgi:plasmid maintenance system antidote protein VapI
MSVADSCCPRMRLALQGQPAVRPRKLGTGPALRLASYFGMAPETWLNLQSEYDLRMVRRASGEEIARTVRKREAV